MEQLNDKKQTIITAWSTAAQKLNSSPWMQRLASGDLQVCHYMGYLLETYHHAGINPQIQAFCTIFFKNNPRKTVSQFYKHAISEIGHDLLALNDLKSLGFKVDDIEKSKPLPSTIALNAFVTHYMQFHSPIGYLGYLFHLEYLPTQNGHSYMEKLAALGVPKSAMSFIEEHATVDIAHNKLMDGYIADLVTTQVEMDHVIYAAQVTCDLHGKMISSAFENGERLFSKKEA